MRLPTTRTHAEALPFTGVAHDACLRWGCTDIVSDHEGRILQEGTHARAADMTLFFTSYRGVAHLRHRSPLRATRSP
jgi:hypothetical protein